MPGFFFCVGSTLLKSAFFEFDYFKTPDKKQKNLVSAVLNEFERFSDLKVDYLFSPPFRETDWQEDQEIVKQINASSVMILFVGLGCPKQEKWMAAHRGQIQAVMIGVGAAFDFHAGLKPQAPQWIQVAGMEWLYRLITEPRRLWKRYFYHNPRFIILALLEFLAYAIKRKE